jgi:tryptophan-rich sensory protein
VAASGAVWFAGDLNANGWVMPNIAPPAWLFPPVWTILYVFIATSAYRIIVSEPHYLKGITYALWTLQLCLNTLWTPVFFGAYDLAGAMIIITFLWAYNTLLLIYFLQNRQGSYIFIHPLFGMGIIRNFAKF